MNIGTLSAFVLVAVGVIVLRRKRPDLPRSFRVPFNPWLPALSALICIYLMLNLSVETWLRFLIWLAVGFIIYFAYSRQRSRIGQPGYIDDRAAARRLARARRERRRSRSDDGGPCRDRTDDIHGVNVALYQLS